MGSELNKSPSLGVTIGWIELKVECSFNEFIFWLFECSLYTLYTILAWLNCYD